MRRPVELASGASKWQLLITEVTEVTRASIDIGDRFEITGKTESTAWSFERPSLMSVEPSESEALEIRANIDPYAEDS